MVNNYFKTSHNAAFNELGNPNDIRSRISEGQRADARKEHYYLGFDKSTFKPARDQTYQFHGRNDSQRNNRSLNVSASSSMYGNTSNALGNQDRSSGATSALTQASIIASKQKTCHITMGGASSN